MTLQILQRDLLIDLLDQSLLSGGNKNDGTEIIGGTANSDAYVRVSTNKKVDIKYQPKTSLADITKRTFTASWSAGASYQYR